MPSLNSKNYWEFQFIYLVTSSFIYFCMFFDSSFRMNGRLLIQNEWAFAHSEQMDVDFFGERGFLKSK